MKKNECFYCEAGECRETWLYIVAGRNGEGPVKIGISFKPVQRLAQHRKKTRRDLVIHWSRKFPCEFAAFDAEDAATDAMDAHRVYGDWFNSSVAEIISSTEKAIK